MRSKHKLRNASTLAGISVFFLLAVLRPAAAQEVIVPDGFVAEVFADGLLNPEGLALDSDGNLISASVGSGEVFSFDDVGNRSLVAFNFSRPIDVVVDGNLLFVTDLDFNGVFTIDLNGPLPVDATTLTPLVSGLDGPTHLEFGPSGALFVSVLRGTTDDRVVKIDVATGTAIDFILFPAFNHNPEGKAFDASGDMFLALQSLGEIRKVSFTGTTPLPIDGATLPVVIDGLDSPGGVDFGEDGKLYIATSTEVVASETSTGTTTTFASGLSGGLFNNLLFDEDGQLFVTDYDGGRIIRIFADTDGDGIPDDEDLCPDTVIPEATVPSVRLGTNRWALVDDDLDFDTTTPKGKGPKRSYNTTETGGCSCEQIIAEQGLGNGHTKHGCSISAMDDWVALVAGAPKRGVGAAEVASVPEAFVLEGNYPNPFNPQTTIRFDLPEAAEVRLIVYDVMGREVARLVDGAMPAGQHRARWDASGLPSGLYLYRLTAGPFSQTKAMALLK